MAFTGDLLSFVTALGVFSALVAGASNLVKRQAPIPAQTPQVFQALDILRGSEPLNAAQVQQVLAYAYPGSSYPTYAYIPQTSFNCNQVRQFGFYADPETRCQVFRRCEANNYMFSYICPNGTVFNQITLICDWFYNVNCPSVGGFYDYSNPRIYRQDLKLFDDYYSGGNSYGGGGGGGGGNSYGSQGGERAGVGGSYGLSGSGSQSSYGILAGMGGGGANGYGGLPNQQPSISTGNMYRITARADTQANDDAR